MLLWEMLDYPLEKKRERVFTLEKMETEEEEELFQGAFFSNQLVVIWVDKKALVLLCRK